MDQVIFISVVIAIISGAMAFLYAKNRSAKYLAEAHSEIAQLTAQLAKASTELGHAEQSFQQEHEKTQALEQKLEAASQSRHEAEKANQTAQADMRAAKDLAQDLKQRLAITDGLLQQERQKVDELNVKLTEQSNRSEGLNTSVEKSREHYSELKDNYQAQKRQLEELQQTHQDLYREHAKLKTTLEERQASHAREVDTFNKQKEELKKDFENLANKIFEEKGKTFTQTSQNSIDGLLKPFREQIEAFQKRVDTVHSEAVKEGANLNAEIKKVLEIGIKMSAEANNLTSALKGDSQQRGAWGEAQLRRTLEMSGLVEKAHFEVQSSFKDADGKQKQTDYLIKLPDNKHIIIDSKVSMVAYDRAVSAETPESYQLAMVEHVKAVRKHIDELSAKDYTNVLGMHSPSFVLMFMPIEPAYIEALKSNKDLFEYGYKKNIVLVSHTTLIPILRTVSNLWMIERSNAEAREISEKAGDIYNQVCTVAERLSKLGGTLNTASTHYNSTVKALVGQQGLYGKVDRFNQLSAKVSKSLPPLDAAHMDFETERLSLIVEPINDPIDEVIDEAVNETLLPEALLSEEVTSEALNAEQQDHELPDEDAIELVSETHSEKVQNGAQEKG